MVEIFTCFKEKFIFYYSIRNIKAPIFQVPEVLNVHMNEIYKKITTIKSNKLKFKQVLNKITFSFSKVNFLLLEKKCF